MNTPTHLLVAAAALAKPDAPRRNAVALAMAIVPDLSIFVMYFLKRVIEGRPPMEIWRVIYWQEPWQTISAISNSIPLWAGVAMAGLAFRSTLLTVAGLAALSHVALDFPVHASDAHVHFWPLTDWRFHSPLSYWDTRHYGQWVSLAEFIFGAVLVVVLLRRFRSPGVRVVLGLALATYVLVPVYFMWSIGSA
ncbi:MAG: hypothetical protein AAFO62_03065 [Pseudomonadota bacterium]